MTNPTSYAAGIEAAARVADTASRLWGSDSKVAEALSALAEDIRSLAPERGRGSGEERYLTAEEQSDLMTALRKSGTTVRAISPAPPAAPSGWRDQAQAILKRAWVCAHQLPGKDGEGEILLRLKSSADAYAVLDLLTAIWRDAAPPPPVPAQALNQAWTTALETAFAAAPVPVQGESGQKFTSQNSDWCAGCGRGWTWVNGREHRAALARIRELEGEVARLKGDCDAYSRTMKVIATLPPTDRDRLTTAAQAARDALENVHRTLNKPNPGICCTVWLDGSPAETLSDHVETALASLASVLDEKPS